MDPKENQQPEANMQSESPVVAATSPVSPDIQPPVNEVANPAVVPAAPLTPPADPQLQTQIASEIQSTQPQPPTVQTVPVPQSSVQPTTEQHKNMGVFGDILHRGNGAKALPKKIALAVSAALVIALLLFGISKLFSGSKIGALVPETQDSVAFMRPSKWERVSDENQNSGEGSDSVLGDQTDGLTYFTEGGKTINETEVNRGMIVSTQNIGVRYNSLSEENKANIRKSFETEFSGKESFSNEQCEEVNNIQSNELAQDGYDIAFQVTAECNKLKNGKSGGRIKMFVGWTAAELHVVGVVADTPTWDANAKTLNEILSSIRPAQ